jgi:hypothetical protein
MTMKATHTIAAMMLVTGMAFGQAPASGKPKAPASQTVAGQASTPAKTPAAVKPMVAAPKPAATPAAKTAAKKAASPMKAKKAAPVTAAAATKPAAKPAALKTEAKPADAPKSGGKRDPFLNPVVRSTGGGPGPVCGAGQRCLIISEVMLQGIVKTQEGMIAVVVNQAKRTYFLKENDPVFNGSVTKITGDTVVFRENVVDNLGKETTREVVKRVSAPVV